MPFNGSGTFNRLYSWVQDAQNGIKIRADRMDADTNGIATGLSDCVTRDGQSPATANLPMGGFSHTNVGDATASNQYTSAKQVQNGSLIFAIAGGTANALTSAIIPSPTLIGGSERRIQASFTNTNTVVTYDDNSQSLPLPITKLGGSTLAVGDIVSGQELILVLNSAGTRWELLNPGFTSDPNEFKIANNLSEGVPATIRANIGLPIGTSGATVPLLNGANTWSATQTFSVAPVFTNQAGTRTALGVTATGADTTYMFRANNGSDIANVSTFRTNLGLGTAALVNTGTSGGTIPLLNAANTWSATQTTASIQPSADLSFSLGASSLRYSTVFSAAFSFGPTATLTAISISSTILVLGLGTSLTTVQLSGYGAGTLVSDASGNVSAASAATERTNLGISDFQSSDFAITAAGTVSVASLSATNATKRTYALVCQTAESNYSVGDIIQVSPFGTGSGGFAAIINSNGSTTIRYSNATNVFTYVDKSTGNTALLTNANWKLRIYISTTTG